MAEIAKWALLVAGLISIIALVVALPIFDLIDIAELTSAVSGLATLVGSYFTAARGIINCFLTPVGRTICTGVIGYLLISPFIKWSIHILIFCYHWIFK